MPSKDKHDCSAQAYDSWGFGSWHSCYKNATHFFDGKWYCGTHHPEKLAERRRKADEIAEEKWKKLKTKRYSVAELQGLADDFVGEGHGGLFPFLDWIEGQE